MSSTLTINAVKEVSAKRRATEAFQPLQGPFQSPQSPKSSLYMTEIPVLANSIFLNVQPLQKDQSGNRFGAKFVGYRALPDGSKGPAEKQNLIRNNEDIILKVDGIQVEFQNFNEIITLLSQCCKRNEAIRLEMKTMLNQSIVQNITPEPKKKKQATDFNHIKKTNDERPSFQLSSVKRHMSIEEAKKSAKGVKKQVLEIENTIKEHENEANILKQKIEQLQKLLHIEKKKQEAAEETKEKMAKQMLEVMELARPDTSRVLEELKKTIVFGTSGSIAKGRSFMNDLLILNQRKELLEAAHLIGASRNPALLEGALQVFVENCSNSSHPFILQALFRTILRQGPSSAFSALEIPWRFIAEGVALAGSAADADLFVRGISTCAEKIRVDNKSLETSRTYGYGSFYQEKRKCHILDIIHPSFEVVVQKFKPEHSSAKQSLERVLINYLYASVRNTIPAPSYCMQVEADIALGEGDKELSAFLRSDKFSEKLNRSQFDWITLQRIIHDRINDAYTMLSYKRDEATNSILLEKVGIGRPETMNVFRDRQSTHARILEMLTGYRKSESAK